jgi:hypothetical protein
MVGSTLTENNYALGFLLGCLQATQSFENITLITGQKLKAGRVLGKITLGAATAAAVAGNTGNGTCSAVTVGVGAQVGVYRVTFIKATTNLGTFIVEAPNGVTSAPGVVGTAFTGLGLTFTLSDGATDFVAGDQFTITVAAGSGKYTAVAPAATDGSAVAAAVLSYDTDATSADVVCGAVVRGAEVNASELDWGSLDAGQILTAKAQLAAINPPITCRTGI